jgi:hypothetical protein
MVRFSGELCMGVVVFDCPGRLYGSSLKKKVKNANQVHRPTTATLSNYAVTSPKTLHTSVATRVQASLV